MWNEHLQDSEPLCKGFHCTAPWNQRQAKRGFSPRFACRWPHQYDRPCYFGERIIPDWAVCSFPFVWKRNALARAGSAPSVCKAEHVVYRSRNIFVMRGKKILILSRINFPDYAFARYWVCKLKLLILDKDRGEGQMSVDRKEEKQPSTDSRCTTGNFMCFYKLKCDWKNY